KEPLAAPLSGISFKEPIPHILYRIPRPTAISVRSRRPAVAAKVKWRLALPSPQETHGCARAVLIRRSETQVPARHTKDNSRCSPSRQTSRHQFSRPRRHNGEARSCSPCHPLPPMPRLLYTKAARGKEMAKNDLQGTLDLLVLKTLAHNGALHGYGIVLHIQSASNDLLRVEEGSLYPALHRMEQSGWIESEWAISETNRRAKYYKLTAQGRRQLQQAEESFDQLVKGVRAVLRYALI